MTDNEVFNVENEAAFAAAIAAVCRKHGLGIAGGIVFQMEHEEYAYSYIVDSNSELIFEDLEN